MRLICRGEGIESAEGKIGFDQEESPPFLLDPATTPPKFNSSPLKSYRNPIGKDRLPTTFFSGSMLNFGRVY